MLQKLIGVKTAGNLLLLILLLIIFFHILIMAGLVPQNIVWGGRVKTTGSELILSELSAVIVLLFFAWIIAAKAGYNKMIKSRKAMNIGVWIVCFYMVLNTVGNLLSGGRIENWVFAPLTFLMAILSLRLALEK